MVNWMLENRRERQSERQIHSKRETGWETEIRERENEGDRPK